MPRPVRVPYPAHPAAPGRACRSGPARAHSDQAKGPRAAAAVTGRGGGSDPGAGRAGRRGPVMSETSRDVLGRAKRAAATQRGVLPTAAPAISLTRSGSRGAAVGGVGGGGRPANHGGDTWPQGARGPVAGRGGRLEAAE